MNILSKVMMVIIVAFILFLLWGIKDYKKVQQENVLITEQLSQQRQINSDYQARIEKLNQIDIQYSQKLVEAKNEINHLRSISERIPERVYIKAECGKNTTSAAGMDDAATARPTDTAIRNYWLLRERIAESEQMIKGLQEYIKTQCL